MTEDMMGAVSITPDSKVVAKRNGSRSMLPSTWTGRSLRLEYTDANGKEREASATLLDWCAVGPVLSMGGARTVLSWDRLALVELVEG